MLPPLMFAGNMRLVEQQKGVEGAIVECGVWRGGMSAAMADVLGPDRHYYLFDSFEGLPPVKEVDGQAAKDWQDSNTVNNCAVEIEVAEAVMSKSCARNVHIVPGWFSETLPTFPPQPIAILRLDADLYDSTIECLNHLFKYVASGGLIIIDDYLYWDGCTRAIHNFLSRHDFPLRLREGLGGVSYIIKES